MQISDEHRLVWSGPVWSKLISYENLSAKKNHNVKLCLNEQEQYVLDSFLGLCVNFIANVNVTNTTNKVKIEQSFCGRFEGRVLR